MKKGISLIVLVITIIVMIIIAGAIIISLNSSNVISQSNKAVVSSDIANLKSALALDYADIMAFNADPSNGTKKDQDAAKSTYEATAAKFTSNTSLATITVTMNSADQSDLRPIVVATTAAGDTVTVQ